MVDRSARLFVGLAAIGVAILMGFSALADGVHPLTALVTFGIAGFVLFDVSRDEPNDT